MNEGLGALENIGKKTMEVLTEGDPGNTQCAHLGKGGRKGGRGREGGRERGGRKERKRGRGREGGRNEREEKEGDGEREREREGERERAERGGGEKEGVCVVYSRYNRHCMNFSGLQNKRKLLRGDAPSLSAVSTYRAHGSHMNVM